MSYKASRVISKMFDPNLAWQWFQLMFGAYSGFVQFLVGIGLAILVFLILVGLVVPKR